MKTQLSHFLSVAEACRILGEQQVHHMVRQLLSLKQQSAQFQSQQRASSSSAATDASLLADTNALVQAMFYAANNNSSQEDLMSTFPSGLLPQTQHKQQMQQQSIQQPAVGAPPPIRQAWKRLTSRTLMLDKMTLLKFTVPVCVQPHAGPGGHMGLFDCLMYALQYKPSNGSSNNPNGANAGTMPAAFGPPLIALPDFIIILAICKDYKELIETRNVSAGSGDDGVNGVNGHVVDVNENGAQVSDEKVKNAVDPDGTVVTDEDDSDDGSENKHEINDSTKQKSSNDALCDSQDPRIQRMARWMFILYDGYQKKGLLSRDTLHRFLSDVYGEDCYKGQAIRNLLDAVFAKSLTLTSHDFTEAVQLTMTMEPYPSHILMDWMAILASALAPPSGVALSTLGFLKQIDQEMRLLPQICEEVGLSESRLYEIKRRFHSLVESGSIIIHGDPMGEGDEELDDSAPDVVQESCMGGTNSRSTSQLPKHVISKASFCRAVCPPNDELGHGGYLPQSVAVQVFSSTATADQFWDLTHVLRFGGTAVRSNEFALVQLLVRMVSNGNKVMNRQNLCQLVTCLCEHWDFRSQNDTSREERDNMEPPTQTRRRSMIEPAVQATEESHVKLSSAAALGLLPAGHENESSGNKYVKVGMLVENLLQQVDPNWDGATLTAEQIMKWHNEETNIPKDKRRLGPLMTELQVISSVLFGIPPRSASSEYAVVLELQRRHKARYPQTDRSRRGPRGTVWYLIDDQWYRAWSGLIKRVSLTDGDTDDLRDKPSAEGNPRRLGRISNTSLLRDNGSLALRPHIKWRHDYDILSPLVWSALQAWYDGGPPIYRSVVPYMHTKSANPHSAKGPRMRTEHEIELYPLFISVFMCDALSRGEARPFQQTIPVSRVSPVRVLLLQLCKGLEIDPDLGRLWLMESTGNARTLSVSSATSMNSDDNTAAGDWLLDLDKSIAEQRRQHGGVPMTDKQITTMTLLLEVKDEESGKWPRGIDGKQYEFRDKKEPQSQLGDGIVGLYNMGNTCYLNSSIQCLGHTPIFRDYFNAKCYLNDINTSNPLGHKGQLAQVSAVLINSLWKRFNQQQPPMPKRVIAPGSYAPVNPPALTPKTFKESLGTFSEHFAGNEQHDAQELLAFLLGGLSEDLNRIVDKPYIEAPDSDGRPDSELADIWWSNHLKREMSIIVALFTGQYKSLLTCRSCKYESARFEPFSFLQLPLPEDDHIAVSLVLYSIRPSTEIMKYSVRVKNDGTLHDVLIALAKILHADENEHSKDDKEDPSSKSAEDAEAYKEQLEQLYRQRAENMAVIDMREGYVFKIAPNSWALPDLQNKDTGELPQLYVYELDPIPEEPTSTTAGSSEVEADVVAENGHASDDEAVHDTSLPPPKRHSYLAIAQRRSEEVAKNLLHPLAHRIFGTPLLLRISELERLTGKELYDLVAQRLPNFVPKSAWRFLTDESKSVPIDSTEKVSKEPSEIAPDSLDPVGPRPRLTKTTTDMEEVAAGNVPRYGFRLRIATRDGRRCALCAWYECCIGCLVPDDDNPTVVMSGDSVVVDWHLAVDLATSGFGTRRSQTDQAPFSGAQPRPRFGVSVKTHPSCGVGSNKRGYAGAITLEDCLDQFAKEEKIPEAYCSKCRDFRVQTKTMSLWRLPPIVIIQLKRFQFTQHMRRKLRDFVSFPVEGLDLSRIMAADVIGNVDPTTNLNVAESEGAEAKQPDTTDSTAPPPVGGATENTNESHDITEGSEEAENASGPTSGTDCESEQESQSPLTSDTGRSEMLYDLYAVVHHQGALSGGHYVASLKSEQDGQWRLFNDAQVFEIHSRDVVDSSAYILFYIRRDVKDAKLSDFWDTKPREDGETVSEEDMDKLIRSRSDRCVIS